MVSPKPKRDCCPVTGIGANWLRWIINNTVDWLFELYDKMDRPQRFGNDAVLSNYAKIKSMIESVDQGKMDDQSCSSSPQLPERIQYVAKRICVIQSMCSGNRSWETDIL